MATPPTQTLAVTCPSCAAHFRVPGEMAGRKGKCARCQAVFRVPAAGASDVKPPAPKPPAPPRYVSVNCRVCQTRLSGLLDQVGKPLKCPDCGAQTILPPPPKENKASERPAAMDGEQYEVWGVDEAPSVAEMLAAQPKYIAVECIMCQTLMHAKPEQVGKKLKCPDCGTANVVPAPADPPKMKDVLASDEFDLDIDPSLDPGERPAVIVPPRKPMLYEEEAEAEQKRREERRAKGDTRGPQYDRDGHAIMPRWPLATRILPFLFSSGVPLRWGVLSVGLFCSVGVILFAISMAQVGGVATLGALKIYLLGLAVFVVWLAATSAVLYTIITESSEGNDSIQSWPAPTFGEWLGEFLYMIVACLVSPLPGWLIGRTTDNMAIQALLFVGSVVVCLPVIMLSQLDASSAFAIASPRIIASLVRLPITWLMFYAEIVLLLGVCVVATVVAAFFPVVLVFVVPLYVAAIILAARILGRLAWKLAETMTVSE